jgi:hypothetical protein
VFLFSVPRAFLVQIGKYESFPLQFAFVSEVDEVAYRLSGDPHVVEKLCFVFRHQFGHRLKFNNDAAERD